jgi:hypothetical protein
MDAIGNGLNGILAGLQVLIDVPPHVIADLAMQLADAVAEGGEMNRQHGEAERLVSAAGAGQTKIDELILRDAGILAIVLVVLAHQFDVERLVARGHGCVGRENGILGDLFTRVGKAQCRP